MHADERTGTSKFDFVGEVAACEHTARGMRPAQLGHHGGDAAAVRRRQVDHGLVDETEFTTHQRAAQLGGLRQLACALLTHGRREVHDAGVAQRQLECQLGVLQRLFGIACCSQSCGCSSGHANSGMHAQRMVQHRIGVAHLGVQALGHRLQRFSRLHALEDDDELLGLVLAAIVRWRDARHGVAWAQRVEQAAQDCAGKSLAGAFAQGLRRGLEALQAQRQHGIAEAMATRRMLLRAEQALQRRGSRRQHVRHACNGGSWLFNAVRADCIGLGHGVGKERPPLRRGHQSEAR